MDHPTERPELWLRLARQTDDVLRSAAEKRRQGRSPGDTERAALRAICREARASAIPVERLLVICKDAWQSLPEAHQLPRALGAETLARVITLCIHEFYASEDGRSGGDGRRDGRAWGDSRPGGLR